MVPWVLTLYIHGQIFYLHSGCLVLTGVEVMFNRYEEFGTGNSTHTMHAPSHICFHALTQRYRVVCRDGGYYGWCR